MATITVTIPDAQVQRVIDAFCNTFGYDPASGLTQAQFSKQQVAIWIKQQVALYEERQRQIQMQAAVPPVTPVDAT